MVAMGKHKLIVTRSFAGLVLLGFGIFNAYDGIVDHLILAIHHAIDMPAPLFADLIWLATLGFAFIAAGAYKVTFPATGFAVTKNSVLSYCPFPTTSIQ